MIKMFYGYRCINRNGSHYPADPLHNEDEIKVYLEKHMFKYPEIKICNSRDEVLIRTIDGRIISPEEDEEYNNQWKNYQQYMKQNFEDIV